MGCSAPTCALLDIKKGALFDKKMNTLRMWAQRARKNAQITVIEIIFVFNFAEKAVFLRPLRPHS